MPKKLYLSERDKKIAGVCGGIGQYFDIDSTIIRLVFVILLFVGGSAIPAYIIAWLIIPREPRY